jgi:hypothetical protein
LDAPPRRPPVKRRQPSTGAHSPGCSMAAWAPSPRDRGRVLTGGGAGMP